MPSFDVVSEVDRQEVRNAVDQAQREIGTRFDFKNTDSSIDQQELVLTLRSVSEDRLAALRVVLEEKLVKRGVSLKGLEYGDVQEATQNTVRQVATIKVGISSDKAREINKLIKERAPKGTSSQTQGESVRVSSKKRDDLQAVIAVLKGADLGIPLQFENMRGLTRRSGRDWGHTPWRPCYVALRRPGGDEWQGEDRLALLDVRNVSVRFGGVVALDDLSFSIDENEICGLIGPNGAGKTTLFNVVSRIYEPESGQLLFDGDDLLRVPTPTRSPGAGSPARSRTWRCSLG